MLMTVFFAPLLAALLMLTQSRHEDRSAGQLATLLAWLMAGLGIVLLFADPEAITWQLGTVFGTNAELMFSLNPTAAGVGMAVLTLLLGPVAIHLGTNQEQRFSLYAGLFSLQSALIGAFLAGDLATFYLCFEGSLIPALWILTQFGTGPSARQSAIRFILYTMAGSFLMLVAIWSIAVTAGTLVIAELAGQAVLPTWCGLAFMLAFAVKTPLVPFHGWQRALYEAAPIGGLVLIAGVMGKLGVYGFLSIVLPIFGACLGSVSGLLIALCVASIIFGALMALRAPSWRSVLAYSSLSHLGFAVLAVVSAAAGEQLQGQGLVDGVLLHMFGHGIAVAAMAAVIAALERRAGSSQIDAVSGLAQQAPQQAVLALLSLLIAVAIPGTISFAAEVMLLGTIFSGAGAILAIVAGLSLVLTAGYLLRLARSVVFGPASGSLRGAEVSSGEWAALVPMIVLGVVLGFVPRLLLNAVVPNASAEPMVAMVEEHK